MLFRKNSRSEAIPLAGSPDARAARARHEQRLERVARQLRAHEPSRPVSLRKKAPSHQVPKAKDRKWTDDKIDLTDLDEILAIDPDARVCVAEPGVTFERLVDATLAHGLVPIIVPEFRTITLGGAIAGCSIESASFKYGGFHDTCLEYEILTAKGERLRCSPDENPLVFQMIHGSFGTLGVVTKLVFRLVPGKRCVRMKYERFSTLAGYGDAIRRTFERGDHDFMDGIIHSPTRYALSLGTFTDDAPYEHRYDWTRVYWTSTWTRDEDYIRTPQYFFRYDHGVTNVRPRSWLGRLLFAPFMRSNEVLALAGRLPWLVPENPNVTLDVFVPFSRADAFLAWYRARIGHYPLWCVPYRRTRDYEWLSDEFWAAAGDDELFLDLAIYGMPQPKGRNVYRELELALPLFGAVKTLISHNFYEEDEFWRTFSRENYDAVKRITDPENVFRDLYSKTCLATRGLPDAPYRPRIAAADSARAASRPGPQDLPASP